MTSHPLMLKLMVPNHQLTTLMLVQPEKAETPGLPMEVLTAKMETSKTPVPMTTKRSKVEMMTSKT